LAETTDSEEISQSWELAQRIDQHFYYKGLVDSGIVLILVIMIVSLVGGDFLSTYLHLPTYTPFIIFGLVGFLFLFLYRDWNKKLREYCVDSNEWAEYYTDLIEIYLNGSLQTKVPTEKKKNRKEALKYTRKFLEIITSYWTVGNFKLAKEYVGDVITTLKTNLKDIVIPIIKEGNEDMIKKVRLALIHFNQKSNELTVEGLREVNDEIKNIAFQKTNKPQSKIDSLIQINRQRPDLVNVLGITVGCIIFGVFLFYAGFGKDTSLIASITVFGILLAYLRIKKS
jgi:predicted negative regulator of RcsB-dependent stress response